LLTWLPQPPLLPLMQITNEPPVGIKAGLRASYQWVTQEMLDAVNR
jgi:dynein heavy chain